jgi:hypothetical protein
VRILLAIIVLFTFQLNADAEESADFASSAAPSNSWSKSHDMFVTPARNEAKVKAIIRDLLGEERPPASVPPEENSAQTPAID